MTRAAENEARLTQGAIQGVVSESERMTKESVDRQTRLIRNMPKAPRLASGIHQVAGQIATIGTGIKDASAADWAQQSAWARASGASIGGNKAIIPASPDPFAGRGMANGGIVRRPTLAMIGERGPEAVVPLGRGGGMGSMNITVNVAEGAIVGVDDLQDTIAQTVRDTAERGGFRGVF